MFEVKLNAQGNSGPSFYNTDLHELKKGGF